VILLDAARTFPIESEVEAPNSKGLFVDYFVDCGTGITSAKIVVSGGLGVGKTTFVASVSESAPVRSEAAVTASGASPGRASTTAALDFGRARLGENLVLCVFGTPGQHRFWFMWDGIVRGAIAAVVLIDARRLADCFAAVDYFEACRLPFLVAVNNFDPAHRFREEDIRDALALPDEIAVVGCDARCPTSARQVLLTAKEYAQSVR